MVEDNLILKQEILGKHNSPSNLQIKNTWYIHDIYQGYAWYMPYKFCKLSKKQSMLDELEIYVCSMAFQDNYSIALKMHDLLSSGYTRYIPGIYHVYTMHIPCEGSLRACLVAHPRLEASDLDFRRSFSVFATERPPTRGWGRPKFHN